jgi:hypothetical protein
LKFEINRRIVILDHTHGEKTHFPSVTHVVTTGQPPWPHLEIEFRKFIGNATRYGLVTGKPVVLVKLEGFEFEIE